MNPISAKEENSSDENEGNIEQELSSHENEEAHADIKQFDEASYCSNISAGRISKAQGKQ
jgi:hypothetical protein